MNIENLKEFVTGVLASSDLADDVYNDLKVNLKDLPSVARVPGIVDKVAEAAGAWKEFLDLNDSERDEIEAWIKTEAQRFKTDSESDKLTEYFEKGLLAAVNLGRAASYFIPAA